MGSAAADYGIAAIKRWILQCADVIEEKQRSYGADCGT